MKTKVIEINPTQVDIIYLDDYGSPLTDSSQVCNNTNWEPRFIGVDIDPLFVVNIEFPVLSFNVSEVESLKVKVTVIDVVPEEAQVIKASLIATMKAQEALRVAESVVAPTKSPGLMSKLKGCFKKNKKTGTVNVGLRTPDITPGTF